MLAVPLTASGDPQAEPATSLPLGFCDLPDTTGQIERGCAAQLIDPPHAKRVNKLGITEPADGSTEIPQATAAGPISEPEITDPPAQTSPTAHADLGPAEAKGLFSSTYEPLLAGLESDPLAGDDVAAMTSSTTAVLDEGPGTDGALLDSSLPLTTGPNHRPVDLTLEEGAGAYEPKRPLVGISLPERAYEPAELPASDFALSFSPGQQGSGDGPSARRIGSQGLFYPSVEADTDLYLTPRPTGLELFAQLRSAESPSELSLDLELPAGAGLHADGAGSGIFEVRSGGEPVAVITPPVALDANGEPVPATMELAGSDRLRISVPHRGSGAAYPILVDPELIEAHMWSLGSDFEGWSPVKTDSDFFQIAYGLNPVFPAGVYNQAPSGQSLGAGTLAQWRYRVPGHGASAPNTTAYIADAYFGSSTFATGTTSQTQPSVALGTFSSGTNQWVRRKTFNQAYTHAGAWLSEWNAPLESGMWPIQATQLDFRLANGSSAITPNTTRTSWLTGTVMKLSDWDDPTSEISGIGGWSDGSEPLEATVHAGDLGLGVKTQFLVSGFDEDEEPVMGPDSIVTSSCSGGVRAPCPRQWDQGFELAPSEELRDGLQLAISGSTDALGKGTLGAAWYGVDRMAPRFEGLGVQDLPSGGKLVTVSAVDGSAGKRNIDDPLDRMDSGSGIQGIILRIDGEIVDPAHEVTQLCEGDGIAGNGNPAQEVPWGSCSLQAAFEVSPGDAAEPMLVTIRDQVGHELSDDPRHPEGSVQAPYRLTSPCGSDEIEEGDVDQLADSTNFSVLESVAATEFGSRYDGAYIDDTCPEHYVVRINEASSMERTNLEAQFATNPATEAGNVDVVRSVYSDAQLTDAAEAAGSMVEDMTGEDFVVGVDQEGEGVTVVTPTALQPSDREEIATQIEPPVSFEDDLETAERHNSRNQFPAYEAGLRVHLTGSSHSTTCTSGYIFKWHGHFLGSTAGHCLPMRPAAAVSVGLNHVGYGQPGFNGYTGGTVKADARLYSVKDAYATKRIMTGEHQHRLVTDRIPNGELHKGLPLCFQGQSSGANNCGRISRIVPVARIEGKIHKESVCIEERLRSGDSGGPVYFVRNNGTARAAGIASWGGIRPRKPRVLLENAQHPQPVWRSVADREESMRAARTIGMVVLLSAAVGGVGCRDGEPTKGTTVFEDATVAKGLRLHVTADGIDGRRQVEAKVRVMRDVKWGQKAPYATLFRRAGDGAWQPEARVNALPSKAPVESPDAPVHPDALGIAEDMRLALPRLDSGVYLLEQQVQVTFVDGDGYRGPLTTVHRVK